MASSSAQSLRLLLAPVVDNNNELTGLAGTLSVPSPNIGQGNALCYNTDGETDSSLTATDDAGVIPLTYEQEHSVQRAGAWLVDRHTVGKVEIKFIILGTAENDATGNKARLRRNHGGIVGIGRGFIPCLALPDITYSIQLKWDIGNSPTGTKVVWTHGEGPEPAPKVGSFDILTESVYMVGQVQSVRYEAQVENHDQASHEETCACYWLGSLPSNLDDVKDFNVKMFPRLSAFFRKSAGSYRTFFRKVPNGLEAQVVKNSSVIDYDEDTKGESDWELVRLINRSMISSWAQLDPEDDGTENVWFSKGLASLYSIYLPYRFGHYSPEYFRATLNGFFIGYFTNPLIQRALEGLPAESDDWYSESIPWLRGCVFMIRMDARMRRASVSQNAGVLRPIDEIVADISERRRKGEKVQARDWIKYVGRWIGEDEAQKDLKSMLDGVPLSMADMETAFDGIDPETQEVLDFGFDRASLDTGIVSGVQEGSKAAEAGLRNGDLVKWYSRPWLCVTGYSGKFKLVVERSGEKLNIEYWPRGTTKARVWQSYPKTAK